MTRWKIGQEVLRADGGQPGGEVEDTVQGVNVEQLGSEPTAAQRPRHADHAGQDQAL